jgi:hypothetical protein
MRANILDRAYQLDSGLGSRVEEIAERRFDFRFIHDPSAYPYNFDNFSFVEWMADFHSEINGKFRASIIRYVLERWRKNLRSYRPYKDSGFYVYLYGPMAPKLGVIPLTHKNRLSGVREISIATIEDFFRPYEERPWRGNFEGDGMPRGPAILKVINAEKGSIGTRTATRLKVSVVQLRNLIEDWGLSEEVNQIRKHNNRRPARLVHWSSQGDEPIPVYHEIWPKNY